MPSPAQDELEVLKGALDASPVVLFVLDAAGHYRLLAGGGFPLTGTGPAERHLGRSLLESEDLPQPLKAAARLALAGEPGELVATLYGRDWEFRLVPVRDGSGQVAGCAGLAIDVTTARREAAGRRESEATLRALVEALPFDVWSRDAAGRPVLQNAESRRLWGELGAGEDGPAQARRGEPGRREVRRPTPDGERTFLEVVAPVVEGERRLGTVGANIDVTLLARSRAQSAFLAAAGHALAASLDYDETLAAVARLAVPVLADACFVDLLEGGVARRVAVSVADPSQEALAQALCRYAPDLDAPAGIPFVLRTGEPFVVSELPELVFTGGEVERRQVGLGDAEHQRLLRELGTRSLLSVPLIARARTLGALTFQARQAGRYGDDDLPFAQELASRAALAVDNARLYREARDAIAARDEFLSIASHELRTPLTALLLCAQSLVRPAPAGSPLASPSYQRRALETIERQSRRLTRLVESLLDVTRAQAGRLELVTAPMDLAELVEEVVGHFDEEARAVGATLQLVRHGPAQGTWDRARLEQVVTNLVSNALKYGEGSTVTVRVDGDGHRALVCVEDQGPGIAAQEQPRLFQRFERLVGGGRAPGLGLGLFIVKKIVDAHGGVVHVESAPGAGAAFVVQLPCRVTTPSG